MSLEFVACPRCRRLACKCPDRMLSRALRLVACGLAVLALAALGSCTRAGAAYETLQAAGYHDIRVGGYSMFRCGSDDSTCTKFEATGPTGVRVYGAVGCGYIGKGCTIRISGTDR